MNANETRPAMVAPPAPASLTGTLIGSAWSRPWAACSSGSIRW